MEGNDVRHVISRVVTLLTRVQVLLVLEDHQFLDVSFFEMINSLLSTGEVGSLLSAKHMS